MGYSAEERADIMNAINDALEPLGYEAVGYVDIGVFLKVLITRGDVDEVR